VWVHAAIEAMMHEVLGMRGTISGGLLAAQRALKDNFDPRGLLNPGKLFSSGGHGSC
jgi:FAD/FMN-containing dehydrogenase